jgi:hypothetical protein
MNYLPPRPCMVLLDDELWYDVLYDDEFQSREGPVWRFKTSRQAVPLDRVVGWGERPGMPDGILTLSLEFKERGLMAFCVRDELCDYMFVDTNTSPFLWPENCSTHCGFAPLPELS